MAETGSRSLTSPSISPRTGSPTAQIFAEPAPPAAISFAVRSAVGAVGAVSAVSAADAADHTDLGAGSAGMISRSGAQMWTYRAGG